MRRQLASASLASAIALATLQVAPQIADASTSVLRCEMPDGSSVYSNKACGSFGARSAPMDAALLTRIKADQRREVRMTAERRGEDVSAALAALDADRLIASAASNRRPVTSGCAGSPQQLASDLQASLALGDVNRVAESFDWTGMANDQAQRIFKQLERLSGSEQLVVDADYFEASIGFGTMPATNGGVMQFTFASAGGTVVDDFRVSQNKGCYFLRYA